MNNQPNDIKPSTGNSTANTLRAIGYLIIIIGMVAAAILACKAKILSPD